MYQNINYESSIYGRMHAIMSLCAFLVVRIGHITLHSIVVGSQFFPVTFYWLPPHTNTCTTVFLMIKLCVAVCNPLSNLQSCYRQCFCTHFFMYLIREEMSNFYIILCVKYNFQLFLMNRNNFARLWESWCLGSVFYELMFL